MPYWLYDKDELVNTPSTKDSIDPPTEARYRREGARFIIEVGTELGLRFDTMASGVVYYHRFYMMHSFKEFPRFVTGSACLFLAGKVEETPKKCKDIIRVAKTQIPDAHWTFFGEDPREEIMTYERILLQTLKFDLQIEHPYQYLLKQAKTFKGEKDKVQKLVQMAWTFVNDSLCTTLCLEWEPDIISIAFLYLAGRLSKSDLMDWTCKNSRTKWWESLNDEVTIDMLEEICHRLLDLYASGQQEKKSIPQPTPTKVSKRPRSKTPPVVEGEVQSTEPAAKVQKPATPPVVEPKPQPSAVESIMAVVTRPKVDQPDWNKQHTPPAVQPHVAPPHGAQAHGQPSQSAPGHVPPPHGTQTMPTSTASYPQMGVTPANYTAPPPVQQSFNNPYQAPPGQQSYNPAYKATPTQPPYQQTSQPPTQQPPTAQNAQYGGYGSQPYYGNNPPPQTQPPPNYNQSSTYNQSYNQQQQTPYSRPPPTQMPPMTSNINTPPPNMNVPPPTQSGHNVHRPGMHPANMNVPPPLLRNAPTPNVPRQMGNQNIRQPSSLLDIQTRPPSYGGYPQENKPMDYPPSQYGNYNQPPPSHGPVRPPHPSHNVGPTPSGGLPTVRITGRQGPHGNMR